MFHINSQGPSRGMGRANNRKVPSAATAKPLNSLPYSFSYLILNGSATFDCSGVYRQNKKLKGKIKSHKIRSQNLPNLAPFFKCGYDFNIENYMSIKIWQVPVYNLAKMVLLLF